MRCFKSEGTTEDETAGWHHWLDGRESEWTPGVGDGQGGLACCVSWGRKESDTTEWLNWELRCLHMSANRLKTIEFYILNRMAYNSIKLKKHQLNAQQTLEIYPVLCYLWWWRKWPATLVFLPGKSHGQRNLEGYRLWGCKESDMTEVT